MCQKTTEKQVIIWNERGTQNIVGIAPIASQIKSILEEGNISGCLGVKINCKTETITGFIIKCVEEHNEVLQQQK